MALGENIGYCARLTQNNTGLYSTNFFAGGIHPALMGDPTLRLHPVKPVSNLTVTKQSSNTQSRLDWTASADAQVSGYIVYRSHDYRGTFKRISTNPVTGTTFTDNQPLQGQNIYMVRALKPQVSPSGTYQNLSQGVFVTADNMSGTTNGVNKAAGQMTLSAYPNPTDGQLWISGNTLRVPIPWS